MMWTLVLLVIAPLLAGLGSLLVSDRRVVEALQYGQAVILLAAGAHVVAGVGTGEPITVGLLLYTDALSAWLDLVLAVVGTTGTLFAVDIWTSNSTAGSSHSDGTVSSFICSISFSPPCSS